MSPLPVDPIGVKLCPPDPGRLGGRSENAVRLVATLGIDSSLAHDLDRAMQLVLPGCRVAEYEPHGFRASPATPAHQPHVLVLRLAPGDATAGTDLAAVRRAHPGARLLALVPAGIPERAMADIDRMVDARLPADATVDHLRDAVVGLLTIRPLVLPRRGAEAADPFNTLGIGADWSARELIEQLPVATVVLQSEHFALLNEAATTLLGRGLAELRQICCWDVLDPAVRLTLSARVRGWIEGQPVEPHGVVPIVTGKGERRWIEVFRRRIHFQGAPALLVTGIDLTERIAWIESSKRDIERFEMSPFAAPQEYQP